MFWIALAAQFSVPALDKQPLFLEGDIPLDVRKTGIPKTVYVRITVRPNGTIEKCTIDLTSGNLETDAHTCGLLVELSKYRPAKWIDGSSAFGVIRMPVTWATADNVPDGNRIPDLDLTVSQLPRGAHSPIGLLLQIAVDADGHAKACGELPPHAMPNEKKYPPELVSVACEALTSSFTAVPAKDDSGKPVRSVQMAYVEFRT